MGSINAENLSDKDIGQNSNDNIISSIESDYQNADAHSINDECLNSNSESDNSLSSIEETPLNEETSNEIYVSVNGDDSIGDGTADKPYKSIRYAVESSSNNSNIHLSEGLYNGEKNRNITIDKNLTISSMSSEAIIDAESISRIFTVQAGCRLTLIGLTLINGYESSESGGSIYNYNGELNLINVRIEKSRSEQYGGAISSMGTLNIENSNFNNNSALQFGGTIFNWGAMDVKDSNFTNSTITAESTTAIGGGIFTNGTSNFFNCNFRNNYAQYSSGAISCYGTTNVNYCTFINQTTNYTAGAISNHDLLIINNSQFLECYAQYYAAAILNPPVGHYARIEAYNTIFEKNHADNHGVVSNNYENTELIMENCAIVGNYIQKNVKYGDISLDENATILYCWWGQNEISEYYYSPHSSYQAPEKINASKWLVMTFTSSNEIIRQDQNNVLTVSLKNYFDNETKETHEYGGDLNLPLTVRIYEGNGNTIGEYMLVNGTVSINYTPKDDTLAVFAKLNNQTIRIPVKQRATSSITASDISAYYKTNMELEVQLKDGNNSALSNKTITISINNKSYNLISDSYGKVKLNISDLSPGSYNAMISFAGDDEHKNASKTVKVSVLKLKTSIDASNLVKYYRNGTKLIVKLLDKDKKALKSKKVQIKIAGKTYEKTTDSKGIARFAINQKAGTYSVKVSFAGDKIYGTSSKTIKVYVKSAKLKVKSKRIHRNKYFVATLKDKNGKAIKKTKVKIKLNGKTYTRTTNKKGVVKLKLSVKIGSYKIKTSFKSTKLYGATVFTKKIKVIK